MSVYVEGLDIEIASDSRLEALLPDLESQCKEREAGEEKATSVVSEAKADLIEAEELRDLAKFDLKEVDDSVRLIRAELRRRREIAATRAELKEARP